MKLTTTEILQWANNTSNMADLWTHLPQLPPGVEVYRQQVIMLLLYKTRQICQRCRNLSSLDA